MGQPVEITRLEHSASELRAFAAKIKDAAIARRLLALALVLEGHSRELAATMNGMTRQTLRDWVHRYNAAGVAGLRSDTGGGAAPLLSASELEELRAIVIEGPDPERHRVVRWRRIDLQRVIVERFGVAYHERTIGKLLKTLGFSHVSARPHHPRQDQRTIEAFKKTSPPR